MQLCYVSACVRPGRAFMSRLLNALRSCTSSPKRTVHPVSDDLRADIIWWSYFLSHYNGVSVIPSDVIISNPELFATDACLTGCGALCFGECFHREFHINELELLTVVISIKLWGPKLQGLGVELLSDNATCVSVINSQHSSNVFMQRCLRELWLLLALYNIKLIVRSVRACDNWLADSLSRFNTGKYCHHFKSLSEARSLTECTVPTWQFLYFHARVAGTFVKVYHSLFVFQRTLRSCWITLTRFSPSLFKNPPRRIWELNWTLTFYFAITARLIRFQFLSSLI